jgi:hypothetical protein
MSTTWYIYTPLPGVEALRLADSCNEQVENCLDEFPDRDHDQCGHAGPGGEIPSADEVISAHRTYREPLPSSILDRLANCRSSIAIDGPGNLELDGLQVAALRYLLERVGRGLIMFNDYPLLNTDLILLELQRKQCDLLATVGYSSLAEAPPFAGEG